MTETQLLITALQTLLPALFCILTAYLVFKMMIQREAYRESSQMRLQAFQSIMPLKLAAYERITLLLERIDIANVVNRCPAGNQTAQSYYEQLLNEVNQEFEHNIVQQLYLSKEAWGAVMHAKRDVLQTLQDARIGLKPQSSAGQYLEALFRVTKSKEEHVIPGTLAHLRSDIIALFEA